MAIDPSTEYGAQVDTGTDPTGYPYGQARNITVPGDGTGTPLEKAWLSDLWGWMQALLDAAGITPSGTPDKVGASQYLTALETLYSPATRLFFVPYRLEDAVYSGLSFNASAAGSSPVGLYISPVGTKMYVLGFSLNTVYQYTLATPDLISSASYDSASISVAAQESSPSGLQFSSDGTKMYVVGTANDTVYQYNLGTAWDLSTASYSSVSFSIAAQETSPNGLQFSSDGTKMYVVGTANDTVYQYTLSSAWDLSTASYASVSFSVAAQEANPFDFTISHDGKKMYVVGANNTIYQYTLGTANTVSSASYDSVSLAVSGLLTTPTALVLSSDGTKIHVSGGSSDSIYMYYATRAVKR